MTSFSQTSLELPKLAVTPMYLAKLWSCLTGEGDPESLNDTGGDIYVPSGSLREVNGETVLSSSSFLGLVTISLPI